MTRPQSSVKTKPKKPYEGFPLTASTNGQWVKKINGKVYSFGRWEDHEAAMDLYESQHHYIRRFGRRPPVDDGLTIDRAISLFLDRQALRLNGKTNRSISLRHFNDLKKICFTIRKTLGPTTIVESIRSDDFSEVLFPAISSKKTDAESMLANSTISRNIANVKSFFNWLSKNGHVAKRLEFGSEFTKPEDDNGPIDTMPTAKEFTPVEVWKMINSSPPNTRAMIFLALNTGVNNSCCANLTKRSVDLENGTLTWKRWKVRKKRQARVRQIDLWSETVDAMRESERLRPTAVNPDHNELFFLTRYGAQWDQHALSREIGKLKKNIGIKRLGVGFNSFRNVIETYGGVDQVAINWVMGHIDPKTAGKYRNETFPRDRILTVTDSVRSWLGQP